MNIDKKEKSYSGKYLQDYDADLYNFSTTYLPRSFDFYIQDVDAVLRDRDGNIRLLEIKRQNYAPKGHQKRTMQILDKMLKHYMSTTDGTVEINVDGRTETHEVNYTGFNLLQLSGNTFDTSDFTLDGVSITREDLIDLLSFSDAKIDSDS